MFRADAIERDFELAEKRFRRLENELRRALQAQAKARADERVNDITQQRLDARAAERAALEAWENLERARVAYWRQRARAARLEVISTAGPLIARAVTFARYAGDKTAVAASITHELYALPVSDVDPCGSVPGQPVESTVLDLADSEVF